MLAAMHWFAALVLGLIAARVLAEFLLERLNARHVRAHGGAVPAPLREVVDDATYARSVAYTLARSRLAQFSLGYDTFWLLLVLFGGGLPWAWAAWTGWAGGSVWAQAGFLFVVGVALSLPDLPVEWWAQFRLEQRFGFNTTTPATWWLDRVKGLLLAAVLGLPLLALILKLVAWMGAWWWLWAWAALMAFQLVMLVLAPVVILPLFNKFTPLPAGPLRERLLALAGATKFPAADIQVMDGSKRSRHSNAFFTGLGRFRKIVLFDTLVTQLGEAELEAVLAHEIGHYRRGHIPQRLAVSALLSLAGFAAVGWLATQPWFFAAFGLPAGEVALALLLFGLLSGTASFWLTPLSNAWSRRHEYEADAFAKAAVRAAEPLVGALRKLHEKNLANLTPHPAYSAFHYSHPTLVERERALRA
jgi:STE24 endopeptidase